jgi:hypothetical protein
VGDAFWLARAEAGYGFEAVRPVIFGDIGTPLSGVGAGVSILDGLVRLDVARGLQPVGQRGWRVDAYLEGRF